MDWGDLLIPIIVAIIAALPGLVALYENRKKNDAETVKVEAETKRTHAETESIHQQVADRWAEHVDDLMGRINRLEEERTLDANEIKGLRLDLNQVRRENEEYRCENADLKDWAERLSAQFSKHVPHIMPEQFIRHYLRTEE